MRAYPRTWHVVAARSRRRARSLSGKDARLHALSARLPPQAASLSGWARSPVIFTDLYPSGTSGSHFTREFDIAKNTRFTTKPIKADIKMAAYISGVL